MPVWVWMSFAAVVGSFVVVDVGDGVATTQLERLVCQISFAQQVGCQRLGQTSGCDGAILETPC